MTLRATLLLLPCLLLGAAHAQERQYTARVVTTVNTTEAAAWRIWRGHLFAVTYPGDWSVTTGGQVTFLSPTEARGDYQESVTMSAFEATPTDTTGWAARNSADARSEFPSATIVSDERQDEAQVIILTLTEDGKALRFKRTIKLTGGCMVVQTYRALEESFTEKEHLADAMMSSVQVFR